MTTDLHEAKSEVNRDLAPEWLELSSHVRQLASSGEDSPLARSAILLCGHVERLHADVQHLLDGLNDSPADDHSTEQHGIAESLGEIDLINIQIQREMHQTGNLRQVIKALFMWKDDPALRIRERGE